MRGFSPFILFLLSGLAGGLRLEAQPGKAADQGPGKATNPASAIFEDLPGSDASSASILRPHENGGQKIRENIFVRAAFDRPTCYVGDQVMLTCKLYTALQSNSSISGKPSLEGFIAREWPEDDGNPKATTREGKEYREFTIWQVVLTPLQPGSFTLDPVLASNDVNYPMADGRTGHYSGIVTSNRASVRVLPLPDAGKPSGYSGLVGRWSVHSRLTADHTNRGEADTLWLEMDGTGSFDNLPMPEMPWPAGLHPLRPFEKWEVKEKSFPEVGRKVIAVPFTASAAGHYTLPPVALAYLEPGGGEVGGGGKTGSGGYHIARSDSLYLVVDSGEVIGKGNAGPVGDRGNGLLLYGLPALLLVIAGGMVLRGRRKSRTLEQPVIAPVENTEPDLAGRLAALDAISDDYSYITEIKQLLISYLQSRLHSDAWAEEELLQQLQSRDSGTAVVVRPTLDLCNELLYAPHLWGAAMRKDLNTRLSALLQGKEDDKGMEG